MFVLLIFVFLPPGNFENLRWVGARKESVDVLERERESERDFKMITQSILGD